VASVLSALATLGLLASLPACSNDARPGRDGGGEDRRVRDRGGDDARADLPGDAPRDGASDAEPDSTADVATDPLPDLPDDATSDARSDLGADGPPGTPCDPKAPSCGDGMLCCARCCRQPLEHVCMPADPDGACPAPDLFVDRQTLMEDLQAEEVNFAPDDCAIVEGCVDAPGKRRVLRFSTMTPNTGTQDLYLGPPDTSNPNFVYSACHGHYHFEGYAEYRLLDAKKNTLATGRKQAFCLLDFGAPYVPGTPEPAERFSCGNQGIHMGFADTYGSYLDCQWLDITDVPPGDYELEVHVNPLQVFMEKDFANNVVRVPVTLSP
jgi:hypothetical protein